MHIEQLRSTLADTKAMTHGADATLARLPYMPWPAQPTPGHSSTDDDVHQRTFGQSSHRTWIGHRRSIQVLWEPKTATESSISVLLEPKNDHRCRFSVLLEPKPAAIDDLRFCWNRNRPRSTICGSVGTETGRDRRSAVLLEPKNDHRRPISAQREPRARRPDVAACSDSGCRRRWRAESDTRWVARRGHLAGPRAGKCLLTSRRSSINCQRQPLGWRRCFRRRPRAGVSGSDAGPLGWRRCFRRRPRAGALRRLLDDVDRPPVHVT